MNAIIKRRQTLLLNWLLKIFPEAKIQKATTGSTYFQYGNKVVRISDHPSSQHSDTLQIILNPFNNSIELLHFTDNFMFVETMDKIKPVLFCMFTRGLCNNEATVETCKHIDGAVSAEEVFNSFPSYSEFITKFNKNNEKIRKEIEGTIVGFYTPKDRKRLGITDIFSITESVWSLMTIKQKQKVIDWYTNKLK